MAKKTCGTCGAPPRNAQGIAWAELGDAPDASGAAAGKISCPHCGAPVQYMEAEELSVPPMAPKPGAPPPMAPKPVAPPPAAPPPVKAPAPAGPPPMDDSEAEGLDESGGELSEMDEDGELMENATDTGDDPGMKDVRQKTTSVEADESVEADDSVESDESVEASDGDGDADDVEAADASQPTRPAPAAPKAMSTTKRVAAKRQLSTERELRRLSEKVASMEREREIERRKERVKKGLTLLQRGLREGKLTRRMIGSPQQPTETRKFAMRDPKGFEQWLTKEAPIAVEFKERGVAKDTDDLTAVSLAERVNTLARDRMKGDSSLSYTDATRLVLNEKPELAQGYDREMSAVSMRDVQAISSNSKL